MSDLVHRNVRSLAGRKGLWRYRAKARLEHFSRAWRYFTGRLTADDAQRTLLALTVEDTLEQAREPSPTVLTLLSSSHAADAVYSRSRR